MKADFIKFKIHDCSTTSASKQGICILLELQNSGDQDVYVSRGVLMLDGFRSNKFSVIDTSSFAVEVPYIGKNVKYHPQSFILKAHDTISNEVNLSDAYDFGATQENEEYKISYESYALICADEQYADCIGKTLHDELLINL